uniref:40S ribosomal protein S6 n=1 Tax=Molossus molossus TaxID=27622 RepID=A0A7J8ERB6_MOLMO|nr:hypothetical protein HJG59_008710 [Molossus molossus]
MKLNISFPATGCQKFIEVKDERCVYGHRSWGPQMLAESEDFSISKEDDACQYVVRKCLNKEAGSVIGFTVLVIVASYIYILTTILKMCSNEGHRKAFSTCSAHLTAVTLFCGTVTFIYVMPSLATQLT